MKALVTILSTLTISFSAFAGSFSDISKIMTNERVMEIAAIGAKNGFDLMSVTNRRILTGRANKGACQTFSLEFRHKDAQQVGTGESFEDRQASLKNFDQSEEICVTSFDDVFVVQLLSSADNLLGNIMLDGEFKIKAARIKKIIEEKN